MSGSRPNLARLPVPAPSWDDCRLLIESVVDYAIFMLDTEGRVATWNPGAERIKGYTASEIIGAHFSCFYCADDLAAGKPQRELETALRLGRVEDEGWRLRKDGSRFWASVVITALRDETGKLRGFGKVTRDLTARRAAEKELRQAEQRFHHLVDAVLDYALFMLDATGHVSTWNVGATRVKGYAAEEIIGRHFSAFYTPEDRAARKPEMILDIVRRDGRYEDESWRVRKDGTRFWANVVISALRDEHGNVTGFAKVTRDLTARREAEETARRLLREQTAREVAESGERRLRESEERYRALSQRLEIVLEGVEDGIVVQDRSGEIVFANVAAAKMWGFESGLVGVSSRDILSRFDMLDDTGRPFPPSRLPGRRVLAGEPPCSAMVNVRERARYREWWALIRASAVMGSDGTPELAISISHDVTARRREELHTRYLADASAALGGSLDFDEMLSTFARVLVPGLADCCAIFVLEHDELREGCVAHAEREMLSVAREWAHVIGASGSREQGVGRVLESGTLEVHQALGAVDEAPLGLEPEDHERLRALGIKAQLIAPMCVRGRTLGVIALASGPADRRFEISVTSLVEELGRRAAVALENAQLYRATQEAARLAEEASRAKDEFLATVSHELRTPLSAIVGWSTLLKERVSDPTLAKPVEVIYRNAQAQSKIVDDILDVSSVITGKFRLDPKPVDAVAVAQQAIEVVRPSAIAKRIDMVFESGSEVCLLVADPDRLQQVIWNLLSNAVKFTRAGGRIVLKVGQVGSSIVLSVSDTGDGIEPAFLPFVFDRFQQADSSIRRRIGGLGLGLAIVRHIVELHGGHVSAESEGLGKGATFTITLPVRAVSTALHEDLATRAGVGPQQPSALLAGLRVLVVDDDPDARELIGTVLRNAGANVIEAASAAAGFDAFRQIRPHVLVSDIGMPDEDGFSLMRRIRALGTLDGGATPSLALTAFAREEDRTKAINAGYTTHIGKPVNPEALASAVANLSVVGRRS